MSYNQVVVQFLAVSVLNVIRKASGVLRTHFANASHARTTTIPDGIKLNQGYVADEDTTIYNPGLTLLTGSEKERLVSAIIDNRKIGLSTNHWSENNEYAFDFLKQKLDPLHMYELQGYLSILPFYGALVYLVGLWAQQNVRGVFPLVYGACAAAVFAPIVILVASGP